MNRICRACDREITVELVSTTGGDDVVEIAGANPDPDKRQSALFEAKVRLACSCSRFDIETDGTVTSLSFLPEEWAETGQYVESLSVQEVGE